MATTTKLSTLVSFVIVALRSSSNLQMPSSDQNKEEGSPRGPLHEDEEEEEWLISCRCESAKAVVTLLSCLEHVSTGEAAASDGPTMGRKKSNSIQPVTVFCSPTSITFHVAGQSKQAQASVDMQAGLFSHYRVSSQGAPEDAQDWQAGGEFSVSLTTVLECLQVLGSLDRTKVCVSRVL
jgi:hypothetical protein